MAKLVILRGVGPLACRIFLRRWPWELLAGPDRSGEVARARALLGVGRFATRNEIVEAHRRLVARVHPDRGGTNQEVVAATAARDLLLRATENPGRKQ